MPSLKTVVCLLFALSVFTSINAWGWKESEAQKIERVERERKEQEARMQHAQYMRVMGQITSVFRLESSYNALKEMRKTMGWFVVVWPLCAAIMHHFDTELGKSYAHWIPHSLVALFIVWGAENILRGQVELNREQYIHGSAAN